MYTIVERITLGGVKRTRLEKAIRLATQSHAKIRQKDKAGKPYILHPLRIMVRMRTEAEMMAAVLHDVVEDTGWTLDALRKEGFPEEVVEAVDCLTQRKGEAYKDFIERLKPNLIARRVKLADLEDNMDVKRITRLSDRDTQRINKYLRFWKVLSEID